MQEEQGRNAELRLMSHPLIAVDSPPSPSGLGFLRQESVLTAQEQESMWVEWPGVATAAAKGKQSLGDGSALSPHLSSGKALFSSALGCREPGTPARDFPAVSASPAWGGSLKTVDHSTQQLLTMGPTPRHV